MQSTHIETDGVTFPVVNQHSQSHSAMTTAIADKAQIEGANIHSDADLYFAPCESTLPISDTKVPLSDKVHVIDDVHSIVQPDCEEELISNLEQQDPAAATLVIGIALSALSQVQEDASDDPSEDTDPTHVSPRDAASEDAGTAVNASDALSTNVPEVSLSTSDAPSEHLHAAGVNTSDDIQSVDGIEGISSDSTDAPIEASTVSTPELTGEGFPDANSDVSSTDPLAALIYADENHDIAVEALPEDMFTTDVSPKDEIQPENGISEVATDDTAVPLSLLASAALTTVVSGNKLDETCSATIQSLEL